MADLRCRIARLEARHAALLAEAERRGVPRREGFGSTTGWLAAHSGDPHGICRVRVMVARALGHMPLVRRAFETGELSEPRVRALTRAYDTNPETFTRDEKLLSSHARRLGASGFRRAVAYWCRLADTEGHLRDHDKAHRDRRLHASVTWGGSVKLDGLLDPESGATLITALRSLTDPTQLDPEDHRTPAQRRADALIELARRHLDDPDRPTVGGEKPHLELRVDLQSLQGSLQGPCELDTGPIPPTVAQRIACDATLRPILTHHGNIIGAGRATRIIPPALRRAVTARDRHCTHPGCDIPAAWCDAHHIIHWAQGGLTILANLTLRCRRHHRMAHQPATTRAPTIGETTALQRE
jgi:hypothetical protein